MNTIKIDVSERLSKNIFLFMVAVILSVALMLLVTVQASAGDPKLTTHTVKWGDTIITIANHYGTSIQAILDLNNMDNPDVLRVGQRLLIPSVSGSYSPASAGNSHVVLEGETLSGIADQYGLSMAALMEANNLMNPDTIYVGQSLSLPATAVSSPASKNLVHTVASGETLSTIAVRYRVAMNDILLANNLGNDGLIFVGEKLIIPGAAEPAAAAQAAQSAAEAPPVDDTLSKSAAVEPTQEPEATPTPDGPVSADNETARDPEWFGVTNLKALVTSNHFLFIGALIEQDSSAIVGYKLKISEVGTGNSWVSNPSQDIIEFSGDQNQGYPYNLKFDTVQMGSSPQEWQLTLLDSGDQPAADPVTIFTHPASPRWFYIVFEKGAGAKSTAKEAEPAPTAVPDATPTSSYPGGSLSSQNGVNIKEFRFTTQGLITGAPNCGATRVKGRITDSDAKPLADVRIKIWSDNWQGTVSSPSSSSGDYEIVINVGAVAGKWYLAAVDNDNQIISPVATVYTSSDCRNGYQTLDVNWAQLKNVHDYVLVQARRLSCEENSGNHHLFISVKDRAGYGMGDVKVRVSWPENSADVITAKEPDISKGHVDYSMYQGTYSAKVREGDSQAANGLSVDLPDETACSNHGNYMYHYSYEVVFQKTK